MGRLSIMMLMCLLAGLSGGQAKGEGNEIQITELTHEELADTKVENNGILMTKTTATHQSCEPLIYSVLEELGALSERFAATVKALEETNKKLEVTEMRLSALNSTVTELSEGKPRVAFSAALPIDGNIGPVNVLYSLVYSHILSNSGGHYNQYTGYFTAPVQGVYYFTYSSLCWGGSEECGGSLYQNGHKVVSWYGHTPNHPTSGSNSAILQLQVGDKINVRLWPNMRISDNVNKYSSFSGFLLFPV
uniref:Uncharacterized LOC111661709 n=1 Tax=Seriola lalandi dorsalis TaxID=1841481 RepID=A0A3B4WYM7_SERLL